MKFDKLTTNSARVLDNVIGLCLEKMYIEVSAFHLF